MEFAKSIFGALFSLLYPSYIPPRSLTLNNVRIQQAYEEFLKMEELCSITESTIQQDNLDS
jgi:hypothetical protein